MHTRHSDVEVGVPSGVFAPLSGLYLKIATSFVSRIYQMFNV